MIRSLLLTGLGLLAVQSDPKPTRAWIDARSESWQPTSIERRWEQIGWAKDLRDAHRIAKSAGRPVFLFTHDGRLGIGRC